MRARRTTAPKEKAKFKQTIVGRKGDGPRPAFVEDRDCWICTGASQGGPYRMANSRPAHREFYSTAHGEIAAGLVIHHLCNRPACVRPDHLIAVSRLDHKKLHAFERRRMRRPTSKPRRGRRDRRRARAQARGLS
jgi:hypothetical protein